MPKWTNNNNKSNLIFRELAACWNCMSRLLRRTWSGLIANPQYESPGFGSLFASPLLFQLELFLSLTHKKPISIFILYLLTPAWIFFFFFKSGTWLKTGCNELILSLKEEWNNWVTYIENKRSRQTSSGKWEFLVTYAKTLLVGIVTTPTNEGKIKCCQNMK